VRGLKGTGRVRLLDVDRGLWLVAADAPLSRYGEKAINAKLSDLDWVSQAAVAHEAVVESFMSATAVLPMKLFTMFATDERAVEHVRGDRKRIRRLLERVANRVEWGVRVMLDRSTASTPATLSSGRTGGRAPASGAAYLLVKKAQRDAATELAERARQVVADLHDRLAARAADTRRRSARELPAPGGPLLLDAAFLVPRSKSARFRSLAAREARALARDGYRLVVTGPWPPYSFIQE